MAKLRGLGRGMDAVFEDNSISGSSPPGMMRISDVEPRRDQPRKSFDEAALAELAASIAQHGVIQPIVVRDMHTGFYSIVAGERRWRAAKMAGLNEIPVVVLDVDDRKASELALIENIQREDLTPLETACAYRDLMEIHGLTQEELAQKVGKSRPAVANTLGLLSLPKEVVEALEAGQITEGHARALKGIRDRSNVKKAVDEVVAHGYSVRGTEELVRRLNRPVVIKEEPEPGIRVDYRRDLEVRMTRNLGRPVHIKDRGRVKKLELEYTDNDDLQDLVEKLCGKLED